MEKRNPLQYFFITLKGMAMGVAELVPGVSGGTIAFVAGIYEEFITAINSVNLSLLQTLKKEGFKAAWEKLNGNFLLALFLGMMISIFSFAKLISWLLINQPIPLWSFFFGLVVASVFMVAKAVHKWNFIKVIIFLIGAAGAFYITTLPPSANSEGLFFIFLSGALAICAMILPGISGSFILVLLGSYKIVLDAVHERDFKIIIIFSLGCLFGLLSFAKLLKWMFNNYKDITLALLTGFIMGSLNKIWPWKTILDTRTYGDKVITIDKNVLPSAFEGEPQVLFAIVAAIVGFALIFTLEKLASKK